MNPNHNCNEEKSSTVEGEWKESELFFFVSLKSHFMVSESWIRLDRHQRVGGYFASDTYVSVEISLAVWDGRSGS